MFSQRFKDWFARPFDPNGSVLNWALFVLLMILLVGIWQTVLFRIAKKVEA